MVLISHVTFNYFILFYFFSTALLREFPAPCQWGKTFLL